MSRFFWALLWLAVGNAASERPEVACRATMGASGPSRVDPDGSGPHGLHLVYCEQELAGGGWTLLWQTSATTDDVDDGGHRSLGSFVSRPRGQAHPLPPSSSYSLGRANWPAHLREVLVVPVQPDGDPDLDDAYHVTLDRDPFPDAPDGVDLPALSVCDLEGHCDTEEVLWRWGTDGFFPRASCAAAWQASDRWHGTFAVCANGHRDHPASSFAGDRLGYQELVLFGFQGNGHAVRVYGR